MEYSLRVRQVLQEGLMVSGGTSFLRDLDAAALGLIVKENREETDDPRPGPRTGSSSCDLRTDDSFGGASQRGY